jgi:hypothetical protein
MDILYVLEMVQFCSKKKMVQLLDVISLFISAVLK